MHDFRQLIQEPGWDTIGKQLSGCPNMICNTGSHCRCTQSPTTRRASTARRFGCLQLLPQAVVRKNQMVVSQRQPQLALG